MEQEDHDQSSKNSNSNSKQDEKFEEYKEKWMAEQLELKKKLITKDGFTWEIPDDKTSEEILDAVRKQQKIKKSKKAEVTESHQFNLSPNTIKYIGGVDISFIKDNEEDACAAFIILSYPDFKVVHSSLEMVKLTLPYIPGFLAFREIPHLMKLIDDVKIKKPEIFPQLIMVDGNGVLHPRGFGLASHLGVLCGVPTIGIGKTYFLVDGLSYDTVKKMEKTLAPRSSTNLVGESGATWGAIMRCTEESTKPIYVSIGHKISLETALKVIQCTVLFRVPEPVRQADQLSREYLRQNPL